MPLKHKEVGKCKKSENGVYSHIAKYFQILLKLYKKSEGKKVCE